MHDLPHEEEVRIGYCAYGVMSVNFQSWVTVPFSFFGQFTEQRFGIWELQFREPQNCPWIILKNNTGWKKYGYDSCFLQHLHLRRNYRIPKRSQRWILKSIRKRSFLHPPTLTFLLHGCHNERRVPEVTNKHLRICKNFRTDWTRFKSWLECTYVLLQSCLVFVLGDE